MSGSPPSPEPSSSSSSSSPRARPAPIDTQPRAYRQSAIPLSPTQTRFDSPSPGLTRPTLQSTFTSSSGGPSIPVTRATRTQSTSPQTSSASSSSPASGRPQTFGPSPSSFPFPPYHVQPAPAASSSAIPSSRGAPPRPPRPEDSTSSRLYNPGWSAPFPSAQVASTSTARATPARPHRDQDSPMFEAVNLIPPTPDRNALSGKGKEAVRVEPVSDVYGEDEDGLQMGFPRTPSLGGGPIGEADEGRFAVTAEIHDLGGEDEAGNEQEELYDQSGEVRRNESPVDSIGFSPSEEMDVAAFLAHAEPPSPQQSRSTPTGSAGSSPALGRPYSLASSHKSKRKPVPKFLPSPSSAEGNSSARLSLGGFEALLVRAIESKRSSLERAEEDVAPPPPPKRSAGMARGASNQSGRSMATSNLPGEVFSPRYGLGLDARGIRAREERRKRDERRRALEYAGAGGGSYSEEMEDEDEDAAERPRATKNVSWSDRLKQAEWEHEQRQAELEAAPALPTSRVPIAPNNVYGAQGRTPEFKPLPLNTTPYPNRYDGAGHNSRWSWGRPAVTRQDELEQVVVVPSSSWESQQNSPNLSDSLLDTMMRPDRMHFAAVEYGTFGRVVHLFYPLAVFFHYPATLFLDYNLLYTLVQLAQHPALPSTLARRAISVPTLHASTAWWTALAVYGTCTLLWAVAVVLYREVGLGYMNIWGSGSVDIGKVYRGSAAFNVGCMQSFSYFSFLWRVRLAAFQQHGDLSVEGGTFVDGIIESCAWYIQNWPTALLLLPRAGISLTILLLFGTTAYGSNSSAAAAVDAARDTAYFHSNGVLTGFASGILLTNLAWTAWRLFLVIGSAVGLFILDGPCVKRNAQPFSAHNHPSREHLTSNMSPDAGFSPGTPQTPRRASFVGGLGNWRARRTRRLRAGILLCLKSITPSSKYSTTHSPAQHSTLPSPYTNRLRKPNSPTNQLKRQEHALKRGHSVTKRSPDLAVRAFDWDDEDESRTAEEEEKSNEAEYAGAVPTLPASNGWAGIGTYAAPSPTVTPNSRLFASPESHDTAATSQYATPNAALAATGMHKRVRSLPLTNEEELIPIASQPLSGAQLIRAGSVSTVTSNRPLPAPPHQRSNSASSGTAQAADRRASVSTTGSRRTPIVIPARGTTPLPAKRRSSQSLLGAPVLLSLDTPPTTPSESHIAPSDEWPFGSSPGGAAAVHTAHLEHFSRQARSEKLLSEVKRLGEQEEASRVEERRLAMLGHRAQGLRPISETSMEGLTSPAMLPLPGTPEQVQREGRAERDEDADRLERVLESPSVGLTDEQLAAAAANRRRRASEQSLLTGEEPKDWSPSQPGAEGLLLPPFNFRLSAIGGSPGGAFQFGKVNQPESLRTPPLTRSAGAGHPQQGDLGEGYFFRPSRDRTITGESAMTDITFASTAAQSFVSEASEVHDGEVLARHLAQTDPSQAHGTPRGQGQGGRRRSKVLAQRREWAIHQSPANTFGQKGPESVVDH